MNTFLWILQAILSIKSITVAVSHGMQQDQEEMRKGIQKMGPIARPLLILIAVLTLLGAVGLIVPAALGVGASIQPLAAALLAVMMLGSIGFHMRCRDKPAIFADVILFAMAAFVAYGRWAIWPL